MARFPAGISRTFGSLLCTSVESPRQLVMSSWDGRWYRPGIDRSTSWVDDPEVVAFDTFVSEVRTRLSRAFIAAYGTERGQEALAEALAFAWEHFEEVQAMENPAGYLYRVGQSRTRRRKQPVVFPRPGQDGIPEVEPRLPGALGSLSERQRVCLALVYAFEWTHQEVADLLGLSRSSVQNHVERGISRLRDEIGAVGDA
jgi:DNA-directed RNA polymerase specialized sigma24 family protein